MDFNKMPYYESTLERVILRRIDRKLELLRGLILSLRGAQCGNRVGLERNVRVLFPRCLHVGDNVTISENSYLHCLSSRGVKIGSFCSFDRNMWLSCGGRSNDYDQGYFEIGARSYIGCNAVIGASGGIVIGSDVLIGQSVNLHAENHDFRDTSLSISVQGVTRIGIIVEDNVWIGSKATILDGVKIGSGSVIGAGSVVTRSIPAHTVAAGNPARIIRRREEDSN